MREILFKAKEKTTNKWIEGYYYKSWGCNDGRMYDIHYIHNYDMDESYEIDINTLCQLTNMTDINGDKVWENDVIESLLNRFTLQVVWSDEHHDFLFKNIEGGYDFMIGKVYEFNSLRNSKNIKIVGNIFDINL